VTLDSLAQWVHSAIGGRLAGGLRNCLSVRVEAPDAGYGPAVFPPPQ
jgi:hypothetical protein